MDGSCGPDPNAGVHVSRDQALPDELPSGSVASLANGASDGENVGTAGHEVEEDVDPSMTSGGWLAGSLCDPPDLPETVSDCPAATDGTKNEAQVSFVNRCPGQAIELFEVDDGCQEVPKGVIESSEFVRFLTTNGRLWRLRHAKTHRLIEEYVVAGSDKHDVPAL